MTMQAAMVGNNGIVLASDTKWQFTARRGNLQTRHTSGSSKIMVSDELGIAIACAKSMETAQLIADTILARLTSADWKSPGPAMEAIAQKVIDATTGDRRFFQCLIVTTSPTLRLFQLETVTLNGIPNRAMCHQIIDKAISGDNANAAAFWAERFYGKDRPVGSLIPLAAQVIVDAAKLNSGFVGGLEVVICDERGPRRLSDDENSAYDVQAERRSEQIANRLYADASTAVPFRVARPQREHDE